MDIQPEQHTSVPTAFEYSKIPAASASAWKIDPCERIMIIAPHPDDEVLAAGGVIATAVGSSNPIRIIIATNGDASYATALSHGSHILTRKNFQRQAVMRQQESLNALASLGLTAQHIHFWGFPDRGVAALWNTHWDEDHPYCSSTTGHQSSIQALNSTVMTYTDESLNRLFQYELVEFSPTLLIMPHPLDQHSDHNSLAGFTLRAVKSYHEQTQLSTPILLAYWMWHKDKPWLTGPRPHNLASFYLQTDSAIVPDLCLTLSPALRDQKLRALQCYPSQKISAGKIFREVSKDTHENFTILQPVH